MSSPFMFENMLSGDPVTTIYGDDVRIVCTDFTEDTPIIAILTAKGQDNVSIQSIETFDRKGASPSRRGLPYLLMKY